MLVANGSYLLTYLDELPIEDLANIWNEGASVQGLKFVSSLLFGLLGIIQVSHAAAPVFGSPAQTRYARQLSPPKGKALIYIYQRQQGGGVSPRIWLNNYEIGRIVPGSFTVWQLAPGRLNLRVGGEEPASVSLISRAGKVYLFRLSVRRTATGMRAEIDSLPGSYRNELAATRFIKNPRQVSAESEPARAPAPEKRPVQTAKTTPPPPKAKPRPRPHLASGIRPGGISLAIKTGALSVAKQTQNILNSDRQFDSNASGLYGIELDYQTRSGTSYGGELLGYKLAYTTVGASGSGDVSVQALMAIAKQYYRTRTRVQPYLGVGIGLASTSVSGAITGSTTGFAYQGLAGIEYRFATTGIFAEYKYVGVQTKSSNGQKIDASGSGIFLGAAFQF